MNKIKNYWTKYWENKIIKGLDQQSQVARTRNKEPINSLLWEQTLSGLVKNLELKKKDIVLDLCCGNGLIATKICQKVKSIYCVDINKKLLEVIKKQKISNLRVLCKDVERIKFQEEKFSKVIWYSGIQYFSHKNIISLAFKIYKFSKPKSIFYIGDIPDKQKLWKYFNTKLRKKNYFDGVLNDKPIIGTWLDKIWLKNLFHLVGFKKVVILKQNKKLIYSDFRFDLLICK
jgi:ubiquinone/menaquinone biosynthesis C-methylase UbiE